MTDREELERLSSAELHERALHRARNHLDVGFLWSLLEAIPAAEAAAGRVDEAQQDVMSLAERIHDLVHADDEGLADQLRPFYIDYLATHED